LGQTTFLSSNEIQRCVFAKQVFHLTTFFTKTIMRTKGKITSWNDDKGFGFITPVAGGKQVFVHIKAFGNRNRRPGINRVVTYTFSADKQGRPRAINATLAGDRLPQKSPRRNISPSMMGANVFMVIVFLAAFSARIPP
jgi:cold shock CspA family protein